MKSLSKTRFWAVILGLIAMFSFCALGLSWTAVKADSATNFVAETGAKVRLEQESTGLRFIATMDTYNSDNTYGFVIVPTDYLDGITEDYIPKLIEKYTEQGIIVLRSTPIAVGESYKIQGSIANLKYANMTRLFTGIPYEFDGTNYTYAQFDDIADISRSVFNVATKAYNQDELLDESEYTADELAIITQFIEQGIAVKNEISKADFDSGVRGEKTFNIDVDEASSIIGEMLPFEVEGVFDADTITYSYNHKQAGVDAENLAVTALTTSETIITAKTYGQTETITLSGVVADNYIASCDKEGYKYAVVNKEGVGHRVAETLKAEIVDDQTNGNVLKITSTVNPSGCADFALVLAKACSSGKLTVRLKMETNETNASYYARFAGVNAENGIYVSGSGGKTNTIIAGETTAQSLAGFADPLANPGEWFTVTLDYGAVSQMDVMIGSATHGSVFTTYIDFVYDGPASDLIKADLVGALGENELANYDNQAYTDFIHLVNGAPSSGDSIDVEYLEEFEGDKGVLKITYNNKSGNDAGIAFDLLKPLSDGASAQYTIRLRFGDSDKVPAAVRMRSCDTYGTVGGKDEWSDSDSPKLVGAKGGWLTKCINTVGQAKNCLTFYTWCPGTTQFVIYVSTIMSGDQVSAIEQAYEQNIMNSLIAGLKDGELANFESDNYTKIVSYNKAENLTHRKAASLTSSIVEVEGVGKVLKVVSVVNSIGCGDVVLTLPKASTAGLRVKIMIETDDAKASAYARFVAPNTESGVNVASGKVNTIIAGATATQSLQEVAPVLAQSGEWVEVALSYGQTSQIDLMIGSATAGSTYNVYFAYVLDGVE